MKISLRSAFLSLAVLAVSISLQAQTNSPLARLSGSLTDSNGGGVGDVQVQARLEGSANPQIWPAKSSPTGEYSLDLPAGRYRVQFTHSSFARREMIVDLASGESKTLNLRLALAPLSSNVVVTANTQPTELAHTPAPIDIVGSQEINERQAVSLPDLLATQTGISLARTGTIGGLTTIFIDGGNSSFTKVLIDGTPVNLPGGDFDFSNITLDNVDKVEIVHGAESALYGTDAMSGVVQIVSHRGTTRVPGISLFAEGGSFSSARGGAQFSGLLGKFDYSAAGSYFHTDGQGVNDAFLNRGFAGNLGYSFSDNNQVHLSVRSNSSFAGAPGQTLLFPPDPSTFYDLQQLSANLTWNFRTGNRWSHHFAAMESRYYSISGGFAGFPNFTNQANRAGGLAQSTYSFRSGAITAGYQHEVENVPAAHAHRNNQGGFLDGRWSPISRLTLSAGGRAEANANFGTRVVPRAGAVLALRYAKGLLGDTRARIAYGQGIEEPTALESFDTDPCSPGNPNLRPQRTRTINVGIDQYFDSDRFRVSVTYFANEFRDLITAVPGTQAGCTFGSFSFLNTDRARARGVNLNSTARLTRWLSLNGNYSHDDTRVLQSSTAGTGFQDPGDHLLRRPINSGNVWVNATYRRFNFNVNAYITGARADSDFDSVFANGHCVIGSGPCLTRNPGYARFDVATNYNFPRGFSFYGRVTNLLDKQYQETIGFPALGRDYRFGLRYQFSGRN
jgi:outer membrane cobalamin receptor